MASVYTRVITVGIREERPDTRNVKEVQLREPDNWFICEMVVKMVDITEELISWVYGLEDRVGLMMEIWKPTI